MKRNRDKQADKKREKRLMRKLKSVETEEQI